MSQRIYGKLLSWLIGVAALSFFYAGEALAVCCKTTSGCSCTSSLSCPLGSTKVSSCSTSGGGLTLNGSTISCISNAETGTVAANRDSEETGVGATYSEKGRGVLCEKHDDSGNSLGTGFFDIDLDYSSTDPATCGPGGVVNFDMFCGPKVVITGTMKPTPGTTPAPWVCEMFTDSKGQLVTPCINPVLALGGFDIQGKTPDCSPFVAIGDLQKGQVLFGREQYAIAESCTGARISAADWDRQFCHDNTFYNPEFETKGIRTNPPCDRNGRVTFRAGISASDSADIVAAKLYDNQWNLGTLNLACSNQGTVPTQIANSENIAVSSFEYSDGPIVAYVTGKPLVFATATSAQPIITNGAPTGLRVTFPDCTSVDFKGLDQVICRGIDYGSNPQTVNLTISAVQADGNGLGFIGVATANINNAASNCPSLVPPQ